MLRRLLSTCVAGPVRPILYQLHGENPPSYGVDSTAQMQKPGLACWSRGVPRGEKIGGTRAEARHPRRKGPCVYVQGRDGVRGEAVGDACRWPPSP